jgi:hypothetical protein
VKAVTDHATNPAEREKIMGDSSRTTPRVQVEQLETRWTPSTPSAAGVLASARPMVSEIDVTKHTDTTSTSMVATSLASISNSGNGVGYAKTSGTVLADGGHTATPQAVDTFIWFQTEPAPAHK